MPDFFEKLRSAPDPPVGSRVQLVSMPGDPHPIANGTMGTVIGGNAAQLSVAWDDGRTLMLLPDVDDFLVVRRGTEAEKEAADGRP